MSLCAVVILVATAAAQQEAEADPPQVVIGERRFLETRFAQFFQSQASDVNAPLAAGDPVLATSETRAAPIPGPFAGQSMNCRVCHLVDDAKTTPGGGSRSYDDFARRSPIRHGRTVARRRRGARRRS